jgi:cell division protein FtsL
MKQSLARKLYYEESFVPRVLPKKKKGWAYVARVMAVCIALFTAGFLIYLGLCSRIVQEQYALDRVQNKLAVLNNRHLILEIQVKKLDSLSRIGRIARTKMGMVFPKHRLYIELQKGSQDKIWGFTKKIVMP